MEKDLKHLTIWLAANQLTLNILKTECMLVGSSQRFHSLDYSRLDLSINGIKLRQVNDTKCLGVTIDEFLTWEPHLTSIIRKASSGIGVVRRINQMVTLENLLNVYRSIIEPYFDCCCIVWDGIGNNMAEKLQRLQNCAARIITNATYSKISREVLSDLGWQTLKERRHVKSYNDD